MTPEAIRDGLTTLLSDPAYREAAREVAAENALQPAPTAAAAAVERLALAGVVTA